MKINNSHLTTQSVFSSLSPSKPDFSNIILSHPTALNDFLSIHNNNITCHANNIKSIQSQLDKSTKMQGLLETLNDKIHEFYHQTTKLKEKIQTELKYIKNDMPLAVQTLEKHLENPEKFQEKLDHMIKEYSLSAKIATQVLNHYLVTEQNKDALSDAHKISYQQKSRDVTSKLVETDQHSQSIISLNTFNIAKLLN